MAELFHDVDIRERTEIGPAGKVEKVYRVTAYTKSDIIFTVDIKEADFSKEKVSKILRKKAQELEEIKAL